MRKLKLAAITALSLLFCASVFATTTANVPVRNGNNYALKTITEGSPININLAAFFKPSNAGPLSFNASEWQSVTLTSPSGATSALRQSVLGYSLYITGTELSGYMPEGVRTGLYTLTVHARNAAGYSVKPVVIRWNAVNRKAS